MNDPYNQMLGLMREEGAFHNEPLFFMGEVISPLPNLKIKVNDIDVDNHSHGDATGPGTHKHEMREPLKNSLDIGDSVVMLRNKNEFIIISKVVSL